MTIRGATLPHCPLQTLDYMVSLKDERFQERYWGEGSVLVCQYEGLHSNLRTQRGKEVELWALCPASLAYLINSGPIIDHVSKIKVDDV